MAMRLYFRDTELSYGEISELLTRQIGPAGPETWQNGLDKQINPENGRLNYLGYIEIYQDHPANTFVQMVWYL